MPQGNFFADVPELDFSLEHCPFCGRSKDKGMDDHDFWEPVECSHACCKLCARPQHDEKLLEPLLFTLCPKCDLANTEIN